MEGLGVLAAGPSVHPHHQMPLPVMPITTSVGTATSAAAPNDSDESNGGPPSIPTSGISSNGGGGSATNTPPPPPPGMVGGRVSPGVHPGIVGHPPPPNLATSHQDRSSQVLLKDVAPLVRLNLVSPPAGFSKLGHPLVYFPDDLEDDFNSVGEGDLHLLFKYYLAVVPRTEQTSGFALILDRRSDHTSDHTGVRTTLRKIVHLFPARIREVYLLHRGNLAVSQLMDEFLLDLDIFHVRDPTELLRHVDIKFLPVDFGGHVAVDPASWIMLQEHVEAFSFNARRIARRLAQFVGVLNSEDVNYRACDSLREIASKNRSCYRRLRKELEDLTEHGLHMLKTLQRPDANVMQRLAVQILCKQLDQAWTYFSRSWKMQDHVYVQYLELNTFQSRFRELANTFAVSERAVRDLPVGGHRTAEEVNAALDKVETCAQSLAHDGARARELSKMGQDLLQDHNFAADCVQPKCNELKMMCQKLEHMMEDKRRTLHKNLDLMESIETLNKWCATASEHLDRDEDIDRPVTANGGTEAVLGAVSNCNGPTDTFSQIRQIDYLLSKSRELKIRSRNDFETYYEDIKDATVSAQTLFAVDDALEQFHNVTARIMQRREHLRTYATRSDKQYAYNPVLSRTPAAAAAAAVNGGLNGSVASPQSPSEPAKIRRENVMTELLTTEGRYVQDLEEVLLNYRDKLAVSNLTETRVRAEALFGNLDEIHAFHARVLEPELERCGVNPAAVARVFLHHCQTIKTLYSSYCQNMDASRQALEALGGESNPTSILVHCQQEAGHMLPLSSYLLKPMQRLTKYQLLLKDLADASNVVCGKVEIVEAMEELVSVVKVVNDSLQNITFKGLPPAAHPLGALVAHDVFTVTSGGSGGGSGMSNGTSVPFLRGSNRGQRRHVFLYENHVVFAKVVSEKSMVYAFKFCLSTASLGMSSVVKGEDKKIDLWLHCRSTDVYTLEAKTKKAKDDFASELRKMIIKQKDKKDRLGVGGVGGGVGGGVSYYDSSAAAAAAAAAERENARIRSRSLESSRAHAPLRSRSLDCAGDRSPTADDLTANEEEDDDEDGFGASRRRHLNGSSRRGHHRGGDRYIVLADYMALTTREIDLSEDDVVELVKVGCAGWWYVRLSTYPYPEGWAPSTYLEKLHDRT